MNIYSFTAGELTRDANTSKDVLAHTLLTSGIINQDQYETITEDLAIIVAEKGFFGKTLDKILNWNNDDALYFRCVQVNNIKYKNKENDVHQSTNGDKERLD